MKQIAVKNSVTIEKTLKSQNCNEMLKNDYINKKFIVQIDHLEYYLLNFEFFKFEQDWRLKQQIRQLERLYIYVSNTFGT